MISIFYNKCILLLESLLIHKRWYLLVALFTMAVIFFVTPPSFFAFTKDFKVCAGCADFKAKIDRADHFFKPTIYPATWHMSKTQFRFTVALVAKVTGIRSALGMYLVQLAFGFAMLALWCLVIFKITADKVISALLTLALSFIYSGKAAVVDTLGYTDAFAYFFLTLVLFTRNKPLLIAGLILACFTDERAIVASSFIGLFFLVEFLELTGNKVQLSAVFRSRLFTYIISLMVYFIIRFVLHKYYGFYTPDDGISGADLNHWGYIFWDGLRGFWLIVIGCCIYLATERRYFILSVMILCMLAVMAVTSLVLDLTRSAAYIFPVIILSIHFFNKAASRPQFRKIALVVCLVSCLCTDTFYIAGIEPSHYRSLPVKIIQKILAKPLR